MENLTEAMYAVTDPESVRRSDITELLAEGRNAEAADIVQMVADQLVNSGSLEFEVWEHVSLICEDVKDGAPVA
jgi:hypothetical protein